MKKLAISIIFASIFFAQTPTFTFAENQFKDTILCGIIDVRCIAKKLQNFRKSLFSSETNPTETSNSSNRNESVVTASFTKQDSGKKDEQTSATNKDGDSGHNNDVVATGEEDTKEKDTSLLCRLGILCADGKKESEESKDSSKEAEYQDKVNSMSEKELAQNPPAPVEGTSEYKVWGENGEVEQPYSLAPGQTYVQEDFSQSSLKPALTNEDLGDFKLTGMDKDCEPFGVINKSNNINVVPQVKSDLARICSAFQRKLVVVDAVRANRVFSNPCQPPSRHLSREAVDFEINKYGTRQEQAMLIVAFIALGYNIGSYEDNFPLHADHGQCPHWQTWSRWAHINGQKARPYQQQVVDALSLMGIQARSSGEFNRNGRVPRKVMVEKAREVIRNTGNQKLIEFILPQETV